MNITDFEKPTEHPYQMLEGLGLQHPYEAESTLAFMLMKCIDAGRFKVIKTRLTHPTLVAAGLLVEDVGGYRLTRKAINLLYSYYSKKG